MTPLSALSFDAWLAQLRRLASERDLQWIIGTDADVHRAGYDQGLRPDEELTQLADMAEWRGCGCGGG